MFIRFLAAALALSACATTALPGPDAVVAAERAFAADGLARGVKASFLAFSAPDAIIFNPEPANAQAVFSAAPDPDPAQPRPPLIWWPLYAGVSRSGDLGFTTGPYAVGEERRGHYFTVWEKQADGAWKWVLDAGVGADAAGEAAAGSPVLALETTRFAAASREAAIMEIAAIERAISAASARGVSSAYDPYLDADSRLHSEGPPPAKDEAARRAAFSARPARMTFAALGGGASEAGDLVWTYGEGRFLDGGVERKGHYVRVWQMRAKGWRIVFDEFLPPAR